MRIAVFSTKSYDREFLNAANERYGHELKFYTARLDSETASLARGYEAVCAFVNDRIDVETLRVLHQSGVRLLVMRCAGYNNVDVATALENNITIARVPAYSPHGVADHTIALILALNRRLNRAFARVREGNFALEGLMGFNMNTRTAGVVGTGKIGTIVVRILCGFGCEVLAYDKYRNPEVESFGAEYVGIEELFSRSDIVTLHCPLSPETHHIINRKSIAHMKQGVMLINTSRGGLLDTAAVVRGLKDGKIGYLGLDVYEEESELFFEDLSGEIIQDDQFMRLVTFPNVLITGHQAFFTREAMENIAEVTLANAHEFEHGRIEKANLVHSA